MDGSEQFLVAEHLKMAVRPKFQYFDFRKAPQLLRGFGFVNIL
jgi:hypothetical protein